MALGIGGELLLIRVADDITRMPRTTKIGSYAQSQDLDLWELLGLEARLET